MGTERKEQIEVRRAPHWKRQVNNVIKVTPNPSVMVEAVLHSYEVEHARRPVGHIEHILREHTSDFKIKEKIHTWLPQWIPAPFHTTR
jgi:hypothetical protein